MLLDLSPERVAFQRALREWVDDACPKQLALELEQREYTYPYELWDKVAAHGLFGIGIDPEYGGAGGGPVDSAIVARELSRNLGGLAWVWAISAFAGARAISTAGNELQRAKHLGNIAAGKTR